jgi:hypothetical protein
MGRPKVSSDGKTIVSGHKSLETDNNSGRVEIWTENEVNTLGDITGLDANYTLNNDGTSTTVTVSADDLAGNEIWWSFATSNATGGSVTEKRHATPFDISKSQTDEISEFSSGIILVPLPPMEDLPELVPSTSPMQQSQDLLGPTAM